MKTKNTKNQKSGLPSRPDEQRSENSTAQQTPAAPAAEKPTRILPYVNYAEREANRALPTEKVLDLLRRWLPAQYNLAEVVGKWVWLDVSPARKPGLANLLWALGFHWNQRRGVWQHPCGSFNPFGIHPADPRAKYRSYFPADVLPA